MNDEQAEVSRYCENTHMERVNDSALWHCPVCQNTVLLRGWGNIAFLTSIHYTRDAELAILAAAGKRLQSPRQ